MHEADIKAMALHALIQADPEKAIPYLTKVLQNRSPETADLREQAVFILGQHESDETLDVMLDVVQNDPDPDVKAHAAFWLSQVNDPRAMGTGSINGRLANSAMGLVVAVSLVLGAGGLLKAGAAALGATAPGPGWAIALAALAAGPVALTLRRQRRL